DGLQLRTQARVAPRVESLQPVLGPGLARHLLDQRALVAHGAADEEALAVLGRDGPARFVQRLAQRAVGDGLAVDEHAVAVEQDGLEIHRLSWWEKSPST